MSLSSFNPTAAQSWQRLKEAYGRTARIAITEFFKQEPGREKDFAISVPGLLVDYSKSRLDRATRDLLLELADELGLSRGIEQYFAGDPINQTEGRAVLHTALRASEEAQIWVNGTNVVPEVHRVRRRIREFADSVLDGRLRGGTGLPFTDVVNIGIGGSDLGPVMAVEALAAYRTALNMHFVNNVDGDHVTEVLKRVPRETTLFIIVSKSFGTQETLTNAQTIRRWFLEGMPEQAVADQFVAVSTNAARIADFGIRESYVFPMEDWVGGRFSLWSAVGLSIALSVGSEHFEALLHGAAAMDKHFRSAPFKENIPVMLGLLSVWYINFHGAETEAVVPYTQYLHRLPAYLQQGVMESNGKSVDRSGKRVDYPTGGIVWGEPGTNSQHAFFQLIHQGTPLIPVDFIGYKRPVHGNMDHHRKLMANYFAQTEALMKGKTRDEAYEELVAQGKSDEQASRLAPYKTFEGNKPTHTLLFDQLTPYSLGQLIALYEHKIFVQGYVWNIHSYDQWGVELGKVLADRILTELENGSVGTGHDASTANLLKYFLL